MQNLRNLEVAFASMFVALVAVFGGFVYMHTVFSADLGLKDMQVDSLITEVGDLKGENIAMYQEFLSLKEPMVILQSESGSEPEEGVAKTVSSNSGETFDVLILGTHGALTDTIMVASVNPALETVSLISIPRDLAVNGRKFNEHYNLYGSEQVGKTVNDILGIMPDKYVVVDMQVFIDIVDVVGGIDVNVEKDLWDNLYPNGKGGYMTVYFAAGEQHMDGADALQYSRSRETTSDFDRAKRQQQVIEAVKEKLDKNPSVSVDVFEAILWNMDTNIGLFEAISSYADYGNYTIESGNVLTTSNYLYSTYNVYGQYILLPKEGDYSEIKEWVGEVVGM